MLLVPGEAIVVRSRDTDGRLIPHPSGAPAIAAWVAARLGTPTCFVGGIGADEPGALIREALSGAGVDLGGLVVHRELPTATADVTYHPDGSRSFQFRVAGSAATAVPAGALGDRPERADWVHVSGSALLFGGELPATVTEAVRRARAAGATVSVDPNLRPELADAERHAALRELCRTADMLFPSEDELAGLDLDVEELVRSGTAVCTTMAADGARIRAGELDVFVPAVARPEEVLDPDGAGDTFAGAVIAGRMHGLDLTAAARAAARVVARAIGVRGPMSVALSAADLD